MRSRERGLDFGNFPKKRGTRGHLLKQPESCAEAEPVPHLRARAGAGGEPPRTTAMTSDPNSRRNPRQSPTSDVCLLLRAHAESRWLSNEFAPVLREVERRESISDRQMGTALAYLEVRWIEAGARARETESARVELDALGSTDVALVEKAHRYHAAVRRLRDAIEPRVCRLLAVPDERPRPERARRPVRRPLNDRPAHP